MEGSGLWLLNIFTAAHKLSRKNIFLKMNELRRENNLSLRGGFVCQNNL